MKSRIAGVVLTAAMACAGLTGTVSYAEAVPLYRASVDYSGTYYVNEEFYFSGGTFSGNQTFLIGDDPLNFNVTAGDVSFSRDGNNTLSIQNQNGIFGLVIPFFFSSGTGTSFGSNFYGPYDFYLQHVENVYINPFNPNYTGDLRGVVTDSSFTLTIATVPLPSSLPLLGAALLSLAGIGFVRRRAMIAMKPAS